MSMTQVLPPTSHPCVTSSPPSHQLPPNPLKQPTRHCSLPQPWVNYGSVFQMATYFIQLSHGIFPASICNVPGCQAITDPAAFIHLFVQVIAAFLENKYVGAPLR